MGQAYLYRRSGAGWVYAQTLFSTWPANFPTSRFGTSIALDSDRMLLSAPSGAVPNASGVVVEFRRVGNSWTTGLLIRPTGGAEVGTALALRDEDAFVGRPDPLAGTVEIYHRDASTWTLVQTLQADATSGGSFGHALSYDGNRLVVGSGGELAVYTRTDSSGFARRYAIVPQTAPGVGFGRVHALRGDLLAVSTSGTVELFELGDSSAQPRGTLVPPTPSGLSITSLALADDALYAGVPSAAVSGRVVMWPRNAFVFGAPEVFVPPADADRAQAFGAVVVSTTGGLVVAAPTASDVATDSWEAGVVHELRRETFRDGFE